MVLCSKCCYFAALSCVNSFSVCFPLLLFAQWVVYLLELKSEATCSRRQCWISNKYVNTTSLSCCLWHCICASPPAIAPLLWTRACVQKQCTRSQQSCRMTLSYSSRNPSCGFLSSTFLFSFLDVAQWLSISDEGKEMQQMKGRAKYSKVLYNFFHK